MAPQVENPNAPSTYGFTPLQMAARCGSTEIFKFLAPLVKNPNAPSPIGTTPLEVATEYNHTEIVEFLSQMLENPTRFNSFLILHTNYILESVVQLSISKQILDNSINKLITIS